MGVVDRPTRLGDRAFAMPGSRGEHDLQELYGTRARAEAFYQKQVLS